MPAGRPPKSLSELNRDGTFRTARHADRLDIVAARPVKPKSLKGHAAKEWDRVCDQLCQYGALAAIDQSSLAQMCDLYGRMVEAQKILEDEGWFVTADRRQVAHPAHKVYCDCYDRWFRLAVEFGLTPVSRNRMKKPAAEKGKADKSRFFQAQENAV